MLNEAIRKFYTQYPYPNPNSYKTGSCHHPISVSGEFDNKNILVIGCGTVEANIIANQHPDCQVLGIDLSETSVEIAKKVAEHEGVTNVSYVVGDFIDYPLNGKFGAMYADGVLHHNRDDKAFVRKVWDYLDNPGGFIGMVYDANSRGFIQVLRHETIQLKDAAAVDKYLRELSEYHPSRQWYENHDKSECELADTWLNPYVKHYWKYELEALLKDNGFKPRSAKFIHSREGGMIRFVALKGAAPGPA
jgi:SAM-dependent methyltransferase